MAEIKDKQNKPRPNKQRKGLVTYFREFKAEFKKIVWSTPKQVVNNTLITIIMVGIVGVFIWILDFVLSIIQGAIY